MKRNDRQELKGQEVETLSAGGMAHGQSFSKKRDTTIDRRRQEYR